MVIMIFILLNVVSLGMYYDDSSKKYNEILEIINLVFTGIFIVECLFPHSLLFLLEQR